MADRDLSSATEEILKELRKRSAMDPTVAHYVLLGKLKMTENQEGSPVALECIKPDCRFPVNTYQVMSGWTAKDTQNLNADNVLVYFTKNDVVSGQPIDDQNSWDVYKKKADGVYSRIRYPIENDSGIVLPGEFIWNHGILKKRSVMIEKIDTQIPDRFPVKDAVGLTQPRIDDGQRITYPEIFGEEGQYSKKEKPKRSAAIRALKNRKSLLERSDSANHFKQDGGDRKKGKLSKRGRKSKRRTRKNRKSKKEHHDDSGGTLE